MTRALLGLGLGLALAACKGRPAATPDAGPDAAPDAPSYAITGRELVRQIANDAQHEPAVTDVPRHTVTITQLLPGGSTAPVTVGADGSFAFASPTAQLRLAVVRDGGVPAEYQLTATQLDFAEASAGRYDRVAPGVGTALVVATTGSTAGTAVVDTTGLWTQTTQPPGSSSNFTLDWTRADALSGPPGLLDAGANDRVYVTYFNNVAGGYVAMNEACSADVTMTSGAAAMAACASAPLTLDRCVHLQAKVVAEDQRLAAALPASTPYTSAGVSWVVGALPAPQVDPVGGLRLAYGGVQTAPSTDIDQDIAFANPFPGHAAAVAVQVARTRSFALPGAGPTSLTAKTLEIVAPAADCTTPTVVMDDVGIAAPPVLDGLALDHDGVTAALDRTRPHALAWGLGASGGADTWVVYLYAATAPAGQTQLALQRVFVAAEPAVELDAADLPAGTYLFRVDGYELYPHAVDGDFRTLRFPAAPFAQSSVWSGSFVVTD